MYEILWGAYMMVSCGTSSGCVVLSLHNLPDFKCWEYVGLKATRIGVQR